MADKTNKKILIVEDDQDFLSILKIKFGSEGFSIVTAENGEQGVGVAEREKPDLILSDVLMPVMDGLEMAKKIRESKNNTSIIFLTNTNIKDIDVENIKKLGGVEFWIKADLPLDEIVNKSKIRLGLV
ncbi:MAG: response regulator [Candidatus Staskawiczbacteria bacterium]|nr:response regulator [Candidatus Staskawiczbacteria bacterium]